MAINPTNVATDAIAYANARTNARIARAQQAASGAKATDSSALLEVSNKLSGRARGVNQALSSANNGVAMTQVAEDALGKVESNLQKLRKLTEKAAQDNLSAEDRTKLQKEAKDLQDKIGKTIQETTYDKTKVLASNAKQTFQTGTETGQSGSVQLSDFSKTFGAVDLSSADAAKKALGQLDSAGKQVDQAQGRLAKAQAQFQRGVDALTQKSQGLSKAQSILGESDKAMQSAADIGSTLRSGGGFAGFNAFGGVDASQLRALLGV
ncbi:MAG: hypothetical protein HQL51_06465 [Magnetococcales bacterium]|nr:hypothetical protein [Magnetococcales bacterium]